MMTPLMYVLAFANFLRPFMRMVYAGAMMFTLITLLETFTRPAWVAGGLLIAPGGGQPLLSGKNGKWFLCWC